MRGAVKMTATGVLGRILLVTMEEALRSLGLCPVRESATLTQPLALDEDQALDLCLPDGEMITFTGSRAGLVIDAPGALGLGVALGGGDVRLSDGRSRWTLSPGVYGPSKLHGMMFSVEVLP